MLRGGAAAPGFKPPKPGFKLPEAVLEEGCFYSLLLDRLGVTLPLGKAMPACFFPRTLRLRPAMDSGRRLRLRGKSAAVSGTATFLQVLPVVLGSRPTYAAPTGVSALGALASALDVVSWGRAASVNLAMYAPRAQELLPWLSTRRAIVRRSRAAPLRDTSGTSRLALLLEARRTRVANGSGGPGN